MSIGGIYTDQRCPICSKVFVDDRQSALRCPDHQQHIAGKFKVKLRGSTARFDNYIVARDYLNAMRKSVSNGTYTKKHYTLGDIQDEFLAWKDELAIRGKIKAKTAQDYRARLNRIVHVIGVCQEANFLSYRHIHDFLYNSGFSPKSTYDSYITFKGMMEWALDMGFVVSIPKFPPYDFSLEHDMQRRKVVDKDTQKRILHQIYIREWDIRPRLYLGVRFLATYINIRPSELLNVLEQDYHRKEKYIVIRKHKVGRQPKIVRLLDEDIALLDELPRGMPSMPLFRHDVPGDGVKAGQRFGTAAFYRAWKRACSDLGIRGVDLYGGTRHSSAISLYKDAGLSPEEIKKATGHKTSIAFTRYFRLDIDDVVEIHAHASPGVPGKIDISEYVEVENA